MQKNNCILSFKFRELGIWRWLGIICWVSASIKLPLARVGMWGSEKLVNITKTWINIIKEERRTILGDSSSEY